MKYPIYTLKGGSFPVSDALSHKWTIEAINSFFSNYKASSLRKKSPYSDLFRSIFSREDTDHNKSGYGHFSRSALLFCFGLTWQSNAWGLNIAKFISQNKVQLILI